MSRGVSRLLQRTRLLCEPLKGMRAQRTKQEMRGNNMQQTILVTGGTGTLGRHVVARLRDAGREVRVLSRHGPRNGQGNEEGIEFVAGDLATGAGIDAAVDGAEVIVHCAGGAKGDGDKALNLVRAASRAGGIQHLVYIDRKSVV